MWIFSSSHDDQVLIFLGVEHKRSVSKAERVKGNTSPSASGVLSKLKRVKKNCWFWHESGVSAEQELLTEGWTTHNDSEERRRKVDFKDNLCCQKSRGLTQRWGIWGSKGGSVMYDRKRVWQGLQVCSHARLGTLRIFFSPYKVTFYKLYTRFYPCDPSI